MPDEVRNYVRRPELTVECTLLPGKRRFAFYLQVVLRPKSSSFGAVPVLVRFDPGTDYSCLPPSKITEAGFTDEDEPTKVTINRGWASEHSTELFNCQIEILVNGNSVGATIDTLVARRPRKAKNPTREVANKKSSKLSDQFWKLFGFEARAVLPENPRERNLYDHPKSPKEMIKSQSREEEGLLSFADLIMCFEIHFVRGLSGYEMVLEPRNTRR
jgi:hypothetical protein